AAVRRASLSQRALSKGGTFAPSASPFRSTTGTTPTARRSLARGDGLGVLEHYLDASVSRAAVGRCIVRNRVGGTQSRHVDRRRCNALRDQVVAYGHRALERKATVDFGAAGVVGMAFDLEAQAGIGSDDAGESRKV